MLETKYIEFNVLVILTVGNICPNEFMHLSMLSRRGGRPGVGGGFDVTSLPVAGTFDHSSSPGGRDF